MLRRAFVVGIAAAATAGFGVGQEGAPAPHTNFSGRWRMDRDKSDFAGFTAPDMVVRVIDQHDPTMNIHTIETVKGKTTSADVSYFLDGSTATNMISGREATSKAFWDGAALMVRTYTKDSKGNDMEMLDRYELSNDGQVLTNTSHIANTKGGVDMKLVSVKEENPR